MPVDLLYITSNNLCFLGSSKLNTSNTDLSAFLAPWYGDESINIMSAFTMKNNKKLFLQEVMSFY